MVFLFINYTRAGGVFRIMSIRKDRLKLTEHLVMYIIKLEIITDKGGKPLYFRDGSGRSLKKSRRGKRRRK